MARNSLALKTAIRDKDAESFHTWLNHADIKDIEEERIFLSGLKGANRYWEVLNKILLKMYEAKTASNHTFDTPNWMEKEIYNKGYMKALEDLYRIIPKTKEE